MQALLVVCAPCQPGTHSLTVFLQFVLRAVHSDAELFSVSFGPASSPDQYRCDAAQGFDVYAPAPGFVVPSAHRMVCVTQEGPGGAAAVRFSVTVAGRRATGTDEIRYFAPLPTVTAVSGCSPSDSNPAATVDCPTHAGSYYSNGVYNHTIRLKGTSFFVPISVTGETYHQVLGSFAHLSLPVVGSGRFRVRPGHAD